MIQINGEERHTLVANAREIHKNELLGTIKDKLLEVKKINETFYNFLCEKLDIILVGTPEELRSVIAFFEEEGYGKKNLTDELIDALKEIIQPYIQDEAAFQKLTEDTNFIDDLKVNSANLVDIVLDIEDKYEIDIDNDSMESMLNVKASLEVIQKKIAEK